MKNGFGEAGMANDIPDPQFGQLPETAPVDLCSSPRCWSCAQVGDNKNFPQARNVESLSLSLRVSKQGP